MEALKKITKEEISKLPLSSFEGQVIVITAQEDAKKCALELQKEKILGFDTETRPSFKKGEIYDTCMIQLATKTKAYIFRINFFQVPRELIEVFESKNIIKAGAAIRDDLKDLQKIFSFKPSSFVEIQDMAKEVGSQNFGLRSMAALFINIRISKSAKLTNWENKNLTTPQLNYAATDAWLGLELYTKIKSILDSK